MAGHLRRAVEAASVTLLGALTGYWLEVFLPSRVRTPQAYTVAILERACWWAIAAALVYCFLRVLSVLLRQSRD